MKPPVVFSPIVNRARKFLKIGNRDDNSPGRQTSKGVSFSNDVYQQTCTPIESLDHSSRRNSISYWYRNSASNFPAKEQILSPRSSVREYDTLWGRKTSTKYSKCNDYEEVDELCEAPKMDEGIFTIELMKPPNGYLGIVLVGGTDTPLQKHYIKDILPNSTAAKDGSLRIGDEIIEVNGHSLRGRTHSLALAVINSLPPLIKIVIERSKDGNRSVLSSCLYQEDSMRADACADPNITSPKGRTHRRSVIQSANETSIINKSVNGVINIPRTGSSATIKPAKLVRRESLCTSFIGDKDCYDDDENFDCEDTKSIKEGGPPEDSSDYDDRLSFLSNTSAWCAKQMINFKSDDQSSSHQDTDSITDTTSVFSMSTLSDSLPPPYTEQETPPEPESSFTRYGSLRIARRVVTESIIEVGSDEEGEKAPEKPTMFLRRGSLRVRGRYSLRGSSCEESEEERATWPTTVRRQRTSLNWDTFVPPPNKSIKRSHSACVKRPSSMYVSDNVPASITQSRAIGGDVSKRNPRKLQRSNSGRFIDKRTITTQVYRAPHTGEWSFTIGGGSYSPYGDLPIHVLNVQDPLFAGTLKNGDEIVSFGGENFSDVTFLEADRKMKNFEGNCVTVVTKRKFLQRKKTQLCTTYADAWNEQARTARRLKTRPESLYC